MLKISVSNSLKTGNHDLVESQFAPLGVTWLAGAATVRVTCQVKGAARAGHLIYIYCVLSASVQGLTSVQGCRHLGHWYSSDVMTSSREFLSWNLSLSETVTGWKGVY